MKSQTSLNLLKLAFLIALIGTMIAVLWISAHGSILPATVSWNGSISY